MPHTRPDSPWRIYGWIALAVVLCYANALGSDFQFDDYNVIVHNPGVHSLLAWRSGAVEGIRPLLKLSYTLNWISGGGVFGFHLVNALIHLSNALLVFALSHQWLTQRTTPLVLQPRAMDCRTIALWTALVFAVHPANTEAVTYVCGRSVSLMALFYLAGIWAYAQGRGSAGRNHTVGYQIATALMFALALATKETAVTFPLALLLWELSCGGSFKSAMRLQWPVWTLSLAVALTFVFSDAYRAHMLRSAEMNTLAGNAATQAEAFAYLMRQWFVPLWPNIDPDLPVLHSLADAWPALGGMLCAVTAIALCWRARPWMAFAIAWCLLHLVPLYLVLPRLDVANDRQLYLAAWPLALAVLVELAQHGGRRASAGFAAVAVLALAALSLLRNQDYANEIALWESTTRLSPGKGRVHNNLGYAYQQANRPDDARRAYTVALRLDPQDVRARYNLKRLDVP